MFKLSYIKAHGKEQTLLSALTQLTSGSSAIASAQHVPVVLSLAWYGIYYNLVIQDVTDTFNRPASASTKSMTLVKEQIHKTKVLDC